jgi:hypothetical protein
MTPAMVLNASSRGKTASRGVKQYPSQRGEEMLMAIPTELFDGLLDGLNAQGEMTELLEELFYDSLS